MCLTLGLLGCEKIDALSKMEQRIAAIEQKNADLLDRPIDLDAKLSALENKQASFELESFGLRAEVARLEHGSAVLSSESKGYHIARNAFGPFIVSLEDIQPHLDGYKVRLSVGNPTYISYRGAEFQVSWANYAESRRITVTDQFLPGTYTEVEAVLTPAKPEDIRQIWVDVSFDQISLSRRPRPEQAR